MLRQYRSLLVNIKISILTVLHWELWEMIMKKFTFPFGILFLFLASQLNYSQIFTENFDYPAGDSLTQHGWIAHSGSGSPLFVWTGSLSYSGYPESGIGNSTYVVGGSVVEPSRCPDSVPQSRSRNAAPTHAWQSR